MMTWAWTLQWALMNEHRKPDFTSLTGAYLLQLAKQLTPWEYLYSEIMWRDPIDESLPKLID